MSENERLGSVVIPAHNEARTIRRCLDALFSDLEPTEIDVVVVCNGCTDGTAEVARAAGHRVRVLDLEIASKPAALRAGDVAVEGFPRLYLDADIVLPGSAARQVLERLRSGGVAARPPIHYDTTRSSAPVRSYYRARCRVPAVLGSLWGAGVYGLSESGRSRFGLFPDLVADDVWVDQHFQGREVEILDCSPAVVAVPRRARDLVEMLRRVYRGNAESKRECHAAERARVTTATALRELWRLVASGPRAGLDAAVYCAFALGARAVVVALPNPAGSWERDNSSRVP